ncbi:hypothetical protein F4780DRAFT_475506 [Xylariomycetidae sp. FL0641]|nr:hypothetical protein F4780DRAFT_475506 [Xylariomycetidae sp. FL0641]
MNEESAQAFWSGLQIFIITTGVLACLSVHSLPYIASMYSRDMKGEVGVANLLVASNLGYLEREDRAEEVEDLRSLRKQGDHRRRKACRSLPRSQSPSSLPSEPLPAGRHPTSIPSLMPRVARPLARPPRFSLLHKVAKVTKQTTFFGAAAISQG